MLRTPRLKKDSANACYAFHGESPRLVFFQRRIVEPTCWDHATAELQGSRNAGKVCAVSDLALIILAALDASFAHDGTWMFRRFTTRASMCTAWRRATSVSSAVWLFAIDWSHRRGFFHSKSLVNNPYNTQDLLGRAKRRRKLVTCPAFDNHRFLDRWLFCLSSESSAGAFVANGATTARTPKTGHLLCRSHFEKAPSECALIDYCGPSSFSRMIRQSSQP